MYLHLKQQDYTIYTILFSGLQMLFLATFFPTWEGGAGVYDFVGVSDLLQQPVEWFQLRTDHVDALKVKLMLIIFSHIDLQSAFIQNKLSIRHYTHIAVSSALWMWHGFGGFFSRQLESTLNDRKQENDRHVDLNTIRYFSV